MTDLAKSELVSKYNYAIVADSSGVIFSKQNCIPVAKPLIEDLDIFDPEHCDYLEDLSFRVDAENVEIYLGDLKLTTLTIDEIEKMIEHCKHLKTT